MPRHIAIIMDGNRRWAKQQGWGAIRGHTVGARTTRDIIQECVDLGICALTCTPFPPKTGSGPARKSRR
jgi:undecaprenyl diphosphate synthase